MKIVKCENEHLYDADKFLFCPHCANQMIGATGKDNTGKGQGQINTEPPGSRSEKDRTAALLGKTVGWLVCIEGAIPGENYTLWEGDNYIGRAASMDVPLLHESTVSRERHAAIHYEPADNSYQLHSLGHPDQTFCNGKAVTDRKTLRDRDIITLGDCSLLFVALCNSSFHWPV